VIAEYSIGSLVRAVARLTDSDSFVRGLNVLISNYGLLRDDDAIVISWCDQRNEIAGEVFASSFAAELFPSGLSRPLENTSVGYFVNRGATIVPTSKIAELSTQEHTDFNLYRDAEVKSVIGVPIVWRGRTIGVVQLLRLTVSEPRHSEFVEQMAVLLAPHLALARSSAMEHTARSRFTDLIKLAGLASSGATTNDLFSGIGSYLRNHVGFDAMSIRIRDSELESSEPTYQQGVIDFSLLENSGDSNDNVMSQLSAMAVGRSRSFSIGVGATKEHLQRDFAAAKFLEHVPSILIAPLWHDREFIGTIECYSLNENAYGVEEVEKIDQLVDITTHRILQSKLTADLNKQIRVREVLAEISRISITGTDSEHILSGICQELSKILQFDHVTFYLPEPLVVTHDGLHKVSDGFTYSSIPSSKIKDLSLAEIESVTASLTFESVPLFTELERLSESDDFEDSYIALSSKDKMSKSDQVLFEEAARHAAAAVNYMMLNIRDTQLTAERKRASRAESDIEHFQEIDRLKKEILSTVTHELRSPLTSISAFADILSRNHPENLTSGQLDNVQAIHRSTETISNIITDLDELAALEPAALDLLYEEIDLAKVIKNVESDTRPILEPNGHQLRLTMKRQVVSASVDRTRLSQVLTNLISNAAKYSEPGSMIRLLLRVSGGNAHFFVKDQGEGIPFSEQQGLFQLFTRAESQRSGDVGGSGIGLYVCEKIVKAHGGQINLHSEFGYGTTIHFWIPLSPTSE